MPSTYTTNLGIEKIATGEQSGTWGNTTNTNLDILDQSIDGIISITLVSAGSSGSPNSLPITDGAVSNGRNKFIEFVDGGDLGATAYVQLTPNDAEKIVHIRNSLSASRSIIVFQGTYNASNDYEILNGEDVLLKFDGAGAGAVVSQVFANLALPSVNIDGGTIDGAVIGGASAAAGSFTTLSASSPISAADGSALTPSITNTGDTNTGIFFPAADTVGVAVGGTEVWRYGSNPTTAKNLIQNGSFAVAQRGTSIAGAPTNYYTLDRWQYRVGSGSETVRITTTQENNGGVSGNDKWIKALVATAESSFGSGNASYYIQRVEANSCLGAFDSSGMRALSISFDAIVHADGASSMSAPYALPVIIQANDGTAKQYVTNVSVTSADTWQHFTVSVPALAGATNDADNENALSVGWGLATGSSRLATANTWETNNNSSGTSASENFADATNNYVGVANIQCEVGSVATDFEHEDYGTTLQKCYRYFQAITIDSNAGYAAEASGSTSAYTAIITYISYNWRATPSASIRTNSNMRYRSYLSGFISATTSSTAGNGASPHAAGFYISCGGTLSGLTDGMPGLLNATGTMLVDFSAEL
jgi:hypothetical protein